MEKPKYKVLIVSHKIDDWGQSECCTNLLSYSLFLEFCKIKDAEVYYSDLKDKTFPEVDFVIIVDYNDGKNNYNFIREQTKAIKICSLIEVRNINCDFNFLFNPEDTSIESLSIENFYIFKSPPCNKDLLKPTPKIPKTVLIDHGSGIYYQTDNDYSSRIERWLEEVKDEYKIYRLVKTRNEKIRDFETAIPFAYYKDYLKSVEFIETFVVTHKESYGYSVIDMASMGSRIIAPCNILENCLVETFSVQLFNDRKTFVKELRTEINKEKLKNQINSCIGFDEITKEINKRFLAWL